MKKLLALILFGVATVGSTAFGFFGRNCCPNDYDACYTYSYDCPDDCDC